MLLKATLAVSDRLWWHIKDTVSLQRSPCCQFLLTQLIMWLDGFVKNYRFRGIKGACDFISSLCQCFSRLLMLLELFLFWKVFWYVFSCSEFLICLNIPVGPNLNFLPFTLAFYNFTSNHSLLPPTVLLDTIHFHLSFYLLSPLLFTFTSYCSPLLFPQLTRLKQNLRLMHPC